MKESTEVVPSGWNMTIEKAQGGMGIMHADLGLTGDVREERGDEGLMREERTSYVSANLGSRFAVRLKVLGVKRCG
ncbi:hypothetical protein CJ030_MR4G020635 [Morella rubra]|uniref:Uncharacterized protein n=1 Tax=Morella rubra TaxID=262757 RepID=A0A6A1VV31_9ROSI|nr:hypothetical protein CJ030_MR4G020635 [Morella rubra]